MDIIFQILDLMSKALNKWTNIYMYVVVKNKYCRAPPKFRSLILVYLKEIELFCNLFLESQCIPLIRLGATTTTNLNKENYENRRFWYFSFKTNVVDCP